MFVGACGLALERAFRDGAATAQQERMRGLAYTLLGAAEADDGGALTIDPGALPEPRLLRPQSGLEAALLDEAGAERWRSPSAVAPLPLVVGPEVGRWRFHRLEVPNRFVLSFGLRWFDDDGTPRRYSLVLQDDPSAYELELGTFRRTLRLWLLGSAAALLVALLAVLHLGLRPLRRLAQDLQAVESGAQPQLGGQPPDELRPLTEALNAMVRSERSQQQRYRNALGDLAHSLKTPLAVLRNLEHDRAPPELHEQVDRMQSIVDHQLAVAAAAGRRTLLRPAQLRPVIDKVLRSLEKVHADRPLDFVAEVPGDLRLRADPGDLYELAGNCIDNAAKWARTRIRVRAHRTDRRVWIVVEDDGPGFPEPASALLERGRRADNRVPGQGLGLAAVADIVGAYEGEVSLARSPDLGGAQVTLKLPA